MRRLAAAGALATVAVITTPGVASAQIDGDTGVIQLGVSQNQIAVPPPVQGPEVDPPAGSNPGDKAVANPGGGSSTVGGGIVNGRNPDGTLISTNKLGGDSTIQGATEPDGVLAASAFAPAPTDVPQVFVSDSRATASAYPGEAGSPDAVTPDPARPNLYPGLGANQRGVVKTFGTENLPKDEQGRPNGRGAVTYSTFVVYQDPVSQKTTPLFRVGVTVYRNVVHGEVQKDSVNIRREVYPLALPNDVNKGTQLTSLGFAASNVDAKAPVRDAGSGDYVLGIVSADVSSKVTVAGFTAFSQHMEVGITVKKDGTVIFESTPSLPVIPEAQVEYLNPRDPSDWGAILERFLFGNPITPNPLDPLSPYRKP